jgi:lipopolysaccharide heptosyltransferase II
MNYEQPMLERWRAARRVLLIRLDNLGDVLVTTPAFHAVRQALPDAELTLLASPVGAQAGRLNPDLNDVIVYRSPQMDPWAQLPHDSQREQRMIETIRERAFDGAIIFTSFRQSSLPAAYLCYLADIPLRHAASIDGPGSLLTTRHKHPERMMHEVERGLDLVAQLGMHTDERDLVLKIPANTRHLPDATDHGSLITHHASLGKTLLVVHPGCSTPARTYPPELFAQSIELLVRELGATVALTGAEVERDLVAQIRASLSATAQRNTLALAGELEFAHFCALIEAADLVITNNTGPMHMAAALKTPVVALFALTNPPEQWGPWRVPHRVLYHDVPCRICYSRICPYGHECLRLVEPEQVLAAAMELLVGEVRSQKSEVRSSNSEPSAVKENMPGLCAFAVQQKTARQETGDSSTNSAPSAVSSTTEVAR